MQSRRPRASSVSKLLKRELQMVSNSTKRRLARIERRNTSLEMPIIVVQGGIPELNDGAGYPMRASVEGEEFTRGMDEPFPQFEARVVKAAHAAGLKLIVIGGL